MKKEELRHDPIREFIIKGIEYLKSKQRILLKVFLILAIMVTIFSYYNHVGSIRIENASIIAGLAQNTYINGEIDEAIVKFERVLNDYPTTFGATQSLIYILNDALTKEEYEVVLNLLSQYQNGIDNINDPIVKAAIYKIKGDIALVNGKLEDADSFFQKASISLMGSAMQVRYQLDNIIALLKQENYDKALTVLEDIIKIDELDYNNKNKAEELRAFVKYKQGT